MELVRQFASTAEPTDSSLVSVLGIDWMMLIFQIVAFLLLVWLLGKFVYPWLLKSVDDRQKKIETSAKAASEAQIKALKTEKHIIRLLSEARAEADEIVANVKIESAATLSAAEEASKNRADHMIAIAQKQIDADILAAKKALHSEMVDLVVLATEKVVGKVVSDKIDNTLIVDAVKDAK